MKASPDHNVVSRLADAARAHAERPALITDGNGGARSISFARLWERVDRCGAGLRRSGLRPTERVILMTPMSIELYVTMLAVLKIGAVGVFVDPWIGRRQIAAFAAFAKPCAWIGSGASHVLRLLESDLRAIRLSVTTGRRLGPLPARQTLAELEREPADGAVYPVSPEDPGLVTFTSGSSGRPKGAQRTHGFLLAQHEALAGEFPSHPDDIDMPMFPVFALNNLAAGVPSVVPDMDFRRVSEVDGARILAQMHEHGVTTCTASPPFVDRVVDALSRDGAAAPVALRRVLTGGAPVSDEQLRRWHAALPDAALPDVELLVVYGSTEAEPVAHIAADERLALDSTGRGYCTGRPASCVRARVVRITDGPIELDERGWERWEVTAGEVGELIVTGRHVCREYADDPRATALNKTTDPEGAVWHRMGDTGSFDTDGRFWLAGRVHSTIRRGGQLVHPQLVEQAARGDDPEVLRAAALGLADKSLGQRVLVVVESGAGSELADVVARRVAQAGFPCDEVRLSAEPLPLDPRHNSKVDYAALARRLGEEIPRP